MVTVTTRTSLTERLQTFEPQVVGTTGGQISYLQSGAPHITHVLLHGIGSASGSWLMQLEAARHQPAIGVLAWDAPGYSASTAVAPLMPNAGHYAERLWAWLDAMGITHPITLVGHSLGALMATRAAINQSARVTGLYLLAPAQGYARVNAADREKKLGDRLIQLAQLGAAGFAQQRGAAMVSPGAPPELVAYVQNLMSRIFPAGYAQAAHMLATGDLLTDLAQVKCPVTVASGQLDNATPMASCQEVAAAVNTDWTDLGPVGHACALEAAARVNALLNLPA